MNVTKFLIDWENAFEGYPPIGYVLRERFAKCWFRIHTLPEGKRYPQTKSEELRIVHRHNALLTYLLGAGERYFLIATDYSHGKIAKSGQHLVDSKRPLVYLCSQTAEEDADNNHAEVFQWNFYVGQRTWRKGSRDALFRRIANDEQRNVLFISFDMKRVYCPYDGGADVFIRDRTLRAQAKERFSSWLSSHPSGL